MANLYTTVEFPLTVNLPPRMLHSGLYQELEDKAKHIFEGQCVPKLGYVKKGSVQIEKKQLGKHEGAHLTGNMTFRMQVHCSAAMPYVGQKLSCMVTVKNEFGVLAINYQLPAYTILVTKMHGDESDALDRIQRGGYIEVEVDAYQLKADNKVERIKAGYLLICHLISVKVEETRYQPLPPVSTIPTLIYNETYDLETIDEKRRELTGGVYNDLEETKNSIQTIRTEYMDMLQEKDDNVKNDIMLTSLLGKNPGNYILGKLLSRKAADGGGRGGREYVTHRMTVLLSNISSLRSEVTSSEFGFGGSGKKTHSVTVQVNRETINEGAVILYHNVDMDNGTASKYSAMDFWGRHVKYIINEAEMVHPNGQYIGQLTEIIRGKSVDMKSTNKGNRREFREKGRGELKASLVLQNQYVINRAYYKMREFIEFFKDELFPRTSMKIACIAECPGGFVQALIDQRRGYNPATRSLVETGIYDDIHGISIGIYCPPWKELVGLFAKHKYFDFVNLSHDDLSEADSAAPKVEGKTNVQLIGGRVRDTGDGNILNAAKRARFYKEFTEENGGKADLITGDAGVERNKKESTEEMDTHRLLLAEVIMALNCQKSGGSFIIKMFDMATEFTMNMLQVLSYCYEEIGLFKPLTSRPATSEKYLVCKRFHVREQERVSLIEALERIHAAGDGGDAYAYYGNMVGVEDPKMKQAVISYNGFFMKKQISFIESGRMYATLYNDTIRSGEIDKMTFDILAKINSQVSTADGFIASI